MVCEATEREFKFWMPLEVTKSSKGDMRIGGIATDENAPDLQGEKVFVRGLDTSYLTNRGVFNWNHGKEPGDILGEIDIAQKNLDKGTLYVEGFLYPGVKKAIDTYDLMRSLKDSGSDRKLGLSVEGKVKERDLETGKQIKKAWIRAVAITYDPINQGAFVDMIKSLGNFTFEPCKGDCSHCTFSECEETKKSSDHYADLNSKDPRDGIPEVATPLIDPRDPIPGPDNVCSKCGKYKTGAASDEICMCDMPVVMGVPDGQVYAEKAISAGHDIPATSGGVSGSALRDEELEKDPKPKVVTYDERHFKENKKRKKMFTKSEVIDLLKEKGIDNPELFTDCIFKAMDLGKSDFSRFGRPPQHYETVAMCENSSRGTSSIGIPKCYNGVQEHEVKVIYHDNPFNESGTTHDILNLCTDCMKHVKQDAEGHGYRVEVTPIKHRKEQWTRRRAGQIEIVHRRSLSKAGGIRDIFERMQSEGKVKGHLRRTRKGTTGWVKPHSRLKKEDQQYKRTLEAAVGKWLDAKDVLSGTPPFAQWIKEQDPKTYKKLIEGIGGQN